MRGYERGLESQRESGARFRQKKVTAAKGDPRFLFMPSISSVWARGTITAIKGELEEEMVRSFRRKVWLSEDPLIST
ncbi:hypothetical protein TNCV_3126721 [Trichonephila clavipes]|nr:hypothetical protein TNCV_3126721 [Trichonephila clavipes]